MATENGSPAFALNAEDIKKIGNGLWISMLGAGLSYLATVGTTIDQTTVQGMITAVVISNAVNIARKFFFPS